MEQRKLGNSDLEITPFTLGTWLTIGDMLSFKELGELVATSRDYGINCIDTADSYGFGKTEIALGKILHRFPIGTFKIFTKLYFPTDSNQKNPNGLSRISIRKCTEASLRRLNLECIDLQQAHRPDPEIPIEETVEGMEELVSQGKIRWWGVSKWDNEEVNTAIGCGARHLISRQDLYNLFHLEPEKQNFEFNQNNNLGFLAYSPLARGVLTGKYNGNIPPLSRAGNRIHKNTVYDLTAPKLKLVCLLSRIAESLEISTAQLTLAYYLHKPSVTSILLGASHPTQLIENLRATSINLSAEVLERINHIFSEKYNLTRWSKNDFNSA